MKFFIKKSKAQGILEVIIAIYIAVVGILSIMNLVISSIKVERLNNDMLVATNLAREGVEIVRNIRDSNWVNGSSWDTGLSYPIANGGPERSFMINNNYLITSNNGYNLIPIGIRWNDCIQQGDLSKCKIWLAWRDDESKKMYVQDLETIIANGYNYSGTNFYRMIYIQSICYDPNQILLENRELINKSTTRTCNEMFAGSTEIGFYIKSVVGWQGGDSMKTITISERIYNWK